MVSRLLVLTIVALGAFAPHAAEACSCIVSGPPCEDYWKATAVFVGRVESIARTTPKPPNSFLRQRVVTLSVLEAFSGVSPGRIEVQTGMGGGDCGYSFRDGAEYLVYARKGEDGTLAVSICSRTRPIAEADEDLGYLRSIVAGTAPASRVSGTVRVGVRDLARQSSQPRPLAGARVALTRAGDSAPTATVETGPDGRFAFDGMQPGQYTASVDAGSRYYATVYPADFELANARACAAVDAMVYDDGRVRGRLMDADSRPVAGMTIELTAPVGLDSAIGPERIRAVTGSDGAFEIVHVPPGRFVVGINTQRPRDGTPGDPRVFYPGVTALASARRIAVGAGERVDLAEFTLPADVRYVPITGLVVDGGGVPVAGARVYLKGPSESDYILSEPVVSDADGRFVVAVVAGREYRVFAEKLREGDAGGRVDSSEQSAVTGDRSTAPVKLTLRRRY